MPEVSVASLDPRHQKLVENARVALERGNLDYALEVTSQVLRHQPGCLPVRKLQRVAQLRQHRAKGGGFMGKTLSGLSAAPFLFGGKKDPAKQLEGAETLLAKDPTSIPALKLLAEAAAGLGLLETAAFALDAVRELEPTNRANLLALGEAWLAAGKPTEALKIADEILRAKPTDAEGQNLMRKASVAQTVTKHNWDDKTSYRDKLRDEAQAVSLEQAGKVKVGDVMARRLLDEHLARLAQEPNNVNHYRSVIQAYRGLGEFDEALHWVRQARGCAGWDAALEKQESELATAAFEKRVKAAEEACASAPEDAAAKAKLELARREFAEFRVTEARRFVERYPNDYAARHALGELLLESGQTDAAIAQFQQAQKGGAVRIPALIGLGRCFKAKRLYDLAIAQLTSAKNDLAQMDDTKKAVIYELGSCFELMGKPDAAIEEFKIIYSEDIGFRDVAEKVNAFYSKA